MVLAAALAMAPARDVLGLANVALLLTLVVVGAAAIGGRIAGVTTAIVGALGFNAIHTRPYGTLRIDRPADVLTCGLMVVVGVSVGLLASRSDERGRRERSERAGVHQLGLLSDLVAAGAPADVLVDRTAECLVRQLGLSGTRFVWGDGSDLHPAAPGRDLPPDLDRTGAIPGALRHAAGGGFLLPDEGASLPVIGRDGTTLGRFVLEPTPGHGVRLEDRELAVLATDLIAPALAAAGSPRTRPNDSPTPDKRGTSR